MRYIPNVVTLALDREKCIGCSQCANVCPHAVFCVTDGKAAVADRDACMECGACARNCPVSAISVRAGVGCATAVLYGVFTRSETCDCGSKCCSS